jgi:hypothetical protein
MNSIAALAVRLGNPSGSTTGVKPKALSGAVLQQRQEISANLGKSCLWGKQAIPKTPKFRHLRLMGIVFGTRGLVELKWASPKGPFGGLAKRP